MEIIDVPDCGNAPRKAVIRDVVTALAEPRPDVLGEHFLSGIEWSIVDIASVTGLEAAIAQAAALPPATTLRFDTLITHGRDAAVNGELGFGDGGRVAFCEVFTFAGNARTAKIRKLTSYRIPLTA